MMTEEPLTLAALIRREQDRNGSSYMDIAKASGLSKAKVGQLADPKLTHQIRPETIRRLAKGLRLPLDVVQRAAMVTAGVADGSGVVDTKSDRISIIAARLADLDDATLDTVERMIDGLADR